MVFSRIHIHGFRNLAVQEIDLAPGFNFITGDNGSGKTSLLEAFYVLIRGRSFRSAITSHAIRLGESSLQVFARLDDPLEDSVGFALGRKLREHHLSGVRIDSSLPVVQRFPVMLLHPPTFSLLDDTSRSRRQVFDWGVFHVEHAFLDDWRRYGRILTHRNHLLRSGCLLSSLASWNEGLVQYGQRIHIYRLSYFERLRPRFLDLCALLLPGIHLDLYYEKGWPDTQDLATALTSTLDKDCRLQHTHAGPHRADFGFLMNDRPVKSFLSRGQIRMLLLAFMVAHVSVVQNLSAKSCLLLVDDLGSELDSRSYRLAFEVLRSLGIQTMMTSLSQPDWLSDASLIQSSVFHVEHGTLSKATIL
ncbi:MAG: replication/repair protein RecF [Pseudomonadota bacterium]|jgi:DNA replication and repair protein RecF